MKNLFLFASMVLCFISVSLTAQVPMGFNYQAIARDADGTELKNKTLKVKLAVKADSTGTAVIWEEVHDPVVTNNFGLFTVVLGKGTRQATSAVTYFSSVNWTAGQYFVKTQVYYLNEWKDMGTTRLWTVPYAMASGNISGTIPRLKVSGTDTSLDSALFEVKNKDGQTIFAVYSEGVRIYVDDGDPGKGMKGGFSIGSFDKTKGGEDLFVVTGDSIRAYIDTGLVKAKKGGFAIGGFSKAKVGREEYFRVTRDSTRVYIDDTPAKALKGGFAIGGFSTAKALPPKYLSVNTNRTNVQVNDSTIGFSVTNIQGGGQADFMKMNKINYFLGHESGLKTVVSGDNGKYNSFLGYMSGHENISGKKNVFLGYRSGYKNNASYNVFVGNETGAENTTGDLNVFIGHQAGTKNISGLRNSFLGYLAGNKNTTGFNNVYMGYYAGGDNQLGDNNTMVGTSAGFSQTAGSRNTFIGSGAGTDNMGGSGNVFIGYKAGADALNVSNQLYIANSNTHALIMGTFGTTDALSQVDVKGSLYVKGVLLSSSDARLKKDLRPVENALGKLLTLNSYYFRWDQENEYSRGMSEDIQVGLLAQEVELVFPELVVTQSNNYKAIDYLKFTPVIVQALKEQNNTISEQAKEIELLKSELEILKNQVTELLKIQK